MKLRPLLLGLLALLGLVAGSIAVRTEAQPAPPGPATGSGVLRYVSARVPVQGGGQELAAVRPALPAARPLVATAPYSNPWQLQATLPGAVIKDIAFPTDQVGYIAAELGQVWKTTNGGATWAPILNLGFPYYWYGVDALDANTVAIAGFINNNHNGVLRWSTDGGATWTPDVVLTTQGWSYRVRFVDSLHGLVLDGLNYNGPNAAHYTTNGGHTAADWTALVPDPNGGWFGNQFSFLPNLKARAAGITYCSSPDGGATWGCRASIDSTFDGPVFFADDQTGWVGGGTISPQVEGWVHRTTDGGTTWSARTVDAPWPIRELRFADDQIGWAAGGDVYSHVGGMYFSSDGGQTWAVDASTGAEMDACASQGAGATLQVWCAGYLNSGSFNGVVYTLPPAVTATATPTILATATGTAPPASNTPTSTPPAASSATATQAPPTSTPSPLSSATPTAVPPTQTTAPSHTPAAATSTPCTLGFSDVHATDYFYTPVQYLACRGVISGYGDGTFRPYNQTTRAQMVKIVVLGFQKAITTPAGGDYTFADVPASFPFFAVIETAAADGIVGGYGCGGAGEPCDPQQRPYFRPYANVTRGQLAKITVVAAGWPLQNPATGTFEDVAPGSAFYQFVETAYCHSVISGYGCGGPGEPCDPQNRPYFRQPAPATRGQIAKIVYRTLTSGGACASGTGGD